MMRVADFYDSCDKWEPGFRVHHLLVGMASTDSALVQSMEQPCTQGLIPM